VKRRKALSADPEKVRAFLQRSRKPLARTALKDARPRAKPAAETMQRAVCEQVRQRQRGVCICGCGKLIAPFPIGFHHVFPRRRWPELTNEPNIIVGVAENCHANHESRHRPLSRAVCVLAEPYATTEPMRKFLDDTYGPA
jgi:hypothetical protein